MELLSIDLIGRRIYLIRGHRTMIDSDLAKIYGVSTKRLNQQLLRNRKRFPKDFAFQLNKQEIAALRLQNATSNNSRGGRRYRPYVFTEHGAVMLSSVLNTPLAIKASILIARAFVKLRRLVTAHSLLAKKLAELEQRVSRHDAQIGDVLDTIRELINPPGIDSRRIGFKP